MSYEHFYRIRDYFRFSISEQRQLLVSAVLFGFILSFRRWGGTEFNAQTGINAWIFAFISILIVIFCSISMQKIFALKQGYRMHYSWWFPGILIGILISFLTFGTVPIIYPGATKFEHMKRLRLGRFRHGINNFDMAMASIAGVVTNALIGLICGMIYYGTHNPYVLYFMHINFIYAFFTLIPIPKFKGLKLVEGATPGLHIYFYTRRLHTFILLSLICYWVLVSASTTFFPSLGLLILAMILGVIGMFFYMKFADETI